MIKTSRPGRKHATVLINKNLCPLDAAVLPTALSTYEGTVTTSALVWQTLVWQNTKSKQDKTTRSSLSKTENTHMTLLSTHIWYLKDRNIDYAINWRIIKRASAYKGKPSHCNLCPAEKLCILAPQSELVTQCRHENKFFVETNQQKLLNFQNIYNWYLLFVD